MPFTLWSPGDQITSEKLNAEHADNVSKSDVYVWSKPNNLSGPGPGGIIVDPTAAPNIARDVTAKASEGYIAMGREALGAATRGRACIAIGSRALGVGNPGFGNLAIGAFALTNTQGVSEFAADLPGSRNIGIGSLAGYFNTSGYYNTFLGRDSGQTATTGIRNTGLGYGAFSRGIAPVGLDGTITNYYATTGGDNTAVGAQAGQMSAGSGNVFAGSQAGASMRDSSSNVVIGAGAASSSGKNISENGKVLTSPAISGTFAQSGTTITVSASGSGVVVGNRVGLTFTSGTISTVTGEMQWLLVASTSGANSFTVNSPVSQTDSGNVTVAIVETATGQVLGGSNTIIGYQANADALSNGGNNTFIGEQTARPASGIQNTIVGSRAGFNQTSADGNTFLGYNAGRALSGGGAHTTQANCTVLGNGASVSGDNQVQLGNTLTTTYVYGTVQNRSDERDKADIRDTQWGLAELCKLRPVDYRWDMRDDYIERDADGEVTRVGERDGTHKRSRFHHGLIAQEVAQVAAETGKDFGGLQDHSLTEGGADVLSLGYDEFVAPLIRAVQELSAMNKALVERVETLESNRK